ncbi:hypothetical protein ScalyP_jg4512 [Parmales sp. scaly parma]|nr:hypothetical protein ScalyP_jg4512 [Parmales sp. scaly parma]
MEETSPSSTTFTTTTEPITDSQSKKRKLKQFKACPPEYTCKLCSTPGHWVYDCSLFVKESNKSKKTKIKKDNNRLPPDQAAPNQRDPTEADIANAKEMQKKMGFINKNRPNCFCGVKSKLSKVKRTKVEFEDPDYKSPALGCFFYFCSKDKWDETKCKFNRPVEEDEATLGYKGKSVKGVVGGKRRCQFFFEKGDCKKGDECDFSHE